jgi:hypothetical protein
MNVFLVVIFNVLILATWVYLLFQVFTVDKDVQTDLISTNPPWESQYNSMILSVKITAFINGILVLLTIFSTMYTSFSSTGGRRR